MEQYPMLCEIGMSFTIVIKPISFGGIIGNVNHQIFLGSDGSVYMKEVLVKPGRDETLHSSTSQTFHEFIEKFPEDAELIVKFMRENQIPMPRWVVFNV